jgi:SAM-dependent methyltransferase
MTLTAQEWHAWFAVQAGWTESTRTWLYDKAGLERVETVLEVGCGTGVITAELASMGNALTVGLDLDPAMLEFAGGRTDGFDLIQGDAHCLPFPDASLDVVICHYLLLWLDEPARGVQEMARVTRPGGYVLACAEPDYGGRIDYPPGLERLGQLQAQALRRQGAEPEMGRRLGELFNGAGLETTVGIMAGRWAARASPGRDFDAEWAMRERDLVDLVVPSELEQLRSIDREALEKGQRTLFVPTFYALGKRL